MDWFERLTGFVEGSYGETRDRLDVIGATLRSRVNGAEYEAGEFELASLKQLRERAGGLLGRLKVKNISGNVRRLHQSIEYSGALFQAASQFNCLEMVSPKVTPEHGVTIYQDDQTQGPGCAIAAGAATIYRNYFVPVTGEPGQTRSRQLDGLADLGRAMGEALGGPIEDLWTMRNGYALCEAKQLERIGDFLRSATPDARDELRSMLQIGVHRNVEVTDGERAQKQRVSQAFCSALPVAYCRAPRELWQPFAELVLEAAYEATIWAGVANTKGSGSNIVLLTRLGGGAFGNDAGWIDRALERALANARDLALDIRLVSFGSPPPSMLALEKRFS